MIGNGVLIRADGTIRDFYQITGAFYGLQSGVQQYSYALFLMDSGAIANIIRSNGCEVRSSPAFSSSMKAWLPRSPPRH